MQYWLMKSEPDEFSISDLKIRPGKKEPWNGIRNYQARNYIRDQMQTGDLAFFYHSNCNPPGIAGIMEITATARPDPSALDKRSKYYDARSSTENPRWFLVDVKYKQQFAHIITLEELRQHSALMNMKLLQKGNRLSVMPVTKQEWDYILGLHKQVT
jgi:predicted RNA-binding protein with PUA-like domain